VSHLGISQTLLGNTALAATVEAEELARVAVPARRGRPELALGNIAGTIVHFAALNAGLIRWSNRSPSATGDGDHERHASHRYGRHPHPATEPTSASQAIEPRCRRLVWWLVKRPGGWDYGLATAQG
jgi:hypothetical protein